MSANDCTCNSAGCEGECAGPAPAGPRAALHPLLVGRRFAMGQAELEAFVNIHDATTTTDSRPDEPEGFEMVGDVAVIQVHGVLETRSTLFGMMFGATSYTGITDAILAAARDKRVASIRLDIDSPGGDVAGVRGAMAAVRSAGKPVVARIVGQCMSAAFWLASAALRIEADATARVGAIGAVMTIFIPQDDESVRHFVSSETPNKLMDTDESFQQVQTLVDEAAAVFFQDLADNRGWPVEDVPELTGRGGMFAAGTALEMGMVDALVTPEDLAGIATPPTPRRPAVTDPSQVVMRIGQGDSGASLHRDDDHQAVAVHVSIGDRAITSAVTRASAVRYPSARQPDGAPDMSDKMVTIAALALATLEEARDKLPPLEASVLSLTAERDTALTGLAAAEALATQAAAEATTTAEALTVVQSDIKAMKDAQHASARSAFVEAEHQRGAITAAMREGLAGDFDANPDMVRRMQARVPNAAAVPRGAGDGAPATGASSTYATMAELSEDLQTKAREEGSPGFTALLTAFKRNHPADWRRLHAAGTAGNVHSITQTR